MASTAESVVRVVIYREFTRKGRLKVFGIRSNSAIRVIAKQPLSQNKKPCRAVSKAWFLTIPY